MRKFVLLSLVVFTASVMTVSSVAQRRGRRRNTQPPPQDTTMVFADETPPTSPHIAEEMGGLQWGASHEQVVLYLRDILHARYRPQLRNIGQVEQDRLMRQRDREVQNIRDSYVVLDNTSNAHRWDGSLVSGEYTQNNNESMLVYEDRSNPAFVLREFYFFFSDRLWKRFQSRVLPRESPMDFATYVSILEQSFGTGLKRMRPDAPDAIETALWQDDFTQLRAVDNSGFYNAFGLVYEDRATLRRLADLRRNQPEQGNRLSGTVTGSVADPHGGNASTDGVNPDIADRITGKIRRNTGADAGAAPQ